jgi:hypothetical protein
MSDGFFSDEELTERFVRAHERLADAIEGIFSEARSAGVRYWPMPSKQKEAVLSRVESDEERDTRLQGARHRTVQEALDPTIDEVPDEYIGERTRQWLRDHPKEAKKPTLSGEELL